MPTIIDGSTGVTFPAGGVGNPAGTVVGTTDTQTLTNKTISVSQLSGTTSEANGGTGTTTGYYGFKNRIINGAMVINQRGSSSYTINSASNTFSVDRFAGYGQATDGVYTLATSSTAPSGFNNSLLATVTTADSSIGASHFYMLRHFIEGYNVADLGWGATGASTVTLSFWVRCSLTGTFGGTLTNDAQSRFYPFSYTINSANTWEQKSVTIAGDTTGTWDKTVNRGIDLSFSFGAGSSVVGTAGSWGASTYWGVTGQTNLIATNGATFYITGVQLEKGSTATSFDYRPYGTELALCQRYFNKFGGNNAYQYFASGMTYISTLAYGLVHFPVEMRSAPTLTYSTIRWTDEGASYAASSAAIDVAGTKATSVQISSTGMTAYRPGFITANNSTSGFVAFSAEL